MQTLVPNKVRKPSGLKEDGTPNLYWKRFESRLKSFSSISVDDWKEEEVLGYLLKRYRDHYGIDFSLSYSGAPTKCGEMYCVRRMMTTVGTQKPRIAKEYIDWVFDTIIIPRKTALESLAFFFSASLCNQFKSVFQKRRIVTRSTELPEPYKQIANSFSVPSTYGDLAFIKMALVPDPTRDDLQTYVKLFEQLKLAGFDDLVLDSLEG